jgi:hypothetical protein
MNSILLTQSDENIKVKKILDCRRVQKNQIEFLVQPENKTESPWWTTLVSPDLILNFVRQYPTKCLGNSEVYCSKKKKIECEKKFANAWFVHELSKFNVGDHNILVLDGPDLNTTLAIQQEIGDNNIGNIHIPNPFSTTEIICLAARHKWIHEKLSLYGQYLNSFLREYTPQQQQFSDVWFDYTSTFSGNDTMRNKMTTPNDDVRLLFEKKLLLNNSLFAITYFDARGAEPLSPKDINTIITKHAKDNGYTLINICKNMKSIPFRCSKDDVRHFSCRDNIVYRYKQMQMMMFRVLNKNVEKEEEELEIEEIIDKRISTDNKKEEEWLIKWKNHDVTTWEKRNDIVVEDDGLWEAERIIIVDVDGSRYIKWKGFGNKFNSWVNKNGFEIGV